MKSETTFKFLTDDDLKLLDQKAESHRYMKDEIVIEEGSRRQALFLIREGKVRVVHNNSNSGQVVPYAILGPGDVIGEMSFLENTGASASVYASTDVVADIYEGYYINALMNSVPGFAARFYQSLAIALAHRVRETSKLIPLPGPEKIPHLPRLTRPSKILIRPDDLPEDIKIAVKEFRRRMLAVHVSEKAWQTTEVVTVAQACRDIHTALSRNVSELPAIAQEIGFQVLVGTFPFFMTSDTFSMAHTQARGYPADYLTIDRIYDNKRTGKGRIGVLIDEWVLDLPLCRSIHGRFDLLSEAICYVRRATTEL